MKDREVFRPKTWVMIAFLAPGLLWYTGMVAVPLVSSIIKSFYNWTGGPVQTFIGFKNYELLLSDRVFWQAFRNNLSITFLSIIGQIGLAFAMACMLSLRFIKLKRLHRTVAYFPATVASVVVGYVWSIVFSYDYGLINSLLRLVGLGGLAAPWLDNPNTIIPVVCIPIIWQYVGYYMIIILAGITSVDKEVYEMAEIDGASGLQKALKITLPLIRGTIGVCIMLCISGNMKIFDHIYTLTGGGPGNSSIVMAMHVYKTTFIKSQFGYASAMSVGIMILSLGLVLLSRLIVNQPWSKGGDI